jgi:hypothetical protein
MSEAPLHDTDTGRAVAGEGWFVLNLGEARAVAARHGASGSRP